jgi:UDP-glucose 4-epimerase
MSRIVVLGANGFIGKHLVRRLASDPANSICAFDRFPEYAAGKADAFHDLENVEITQGNFLNKADLSEALSGADYVFHMISTTNPAVSASDPYIDIDTNVRGSIMLFELCVQYGVKRVIFPSSGGTVYGDTTIESINEDVTPQPISPYGIGKLTIEHYLRYFERVHGLDYIVFRIANPYGPGQNVHGRQGVIPIFLNAVIENKPITIYGDGSMVRDYVYIGDLVEMINGIYDKPHRYNTYNIGSANGVSVNEIVSSIELSIGRKVHTESRPTPPTYVSRSILNMRRLGEEFGLRAEMTIQDGVARTWESLQRHNRSSSADV